MGGGGGYPSFFVQKVNKSRQFFALQGKFEVTQNVIEEIWLTGYGSDPILSRGTSWSQLRQCV